MGKVEPNRVPQQYCESQPDASLIYALSPADKQLLFVLRSLNLANKCPDTAAACVNMRALLFPSPSTCVCSNCFTGWFQTSYSSLRLIGLICNNSFESEAGRFPTVVQFLSYGVTCNANTVLQKFIKPQKSSHLLIFSSLQLKLFV